jgi:hypothetical protein
MTYLSFGRHGHTESTKRKMKPNRRMILKDISVIAYLKVVSQHHLHGGTKENPERPQLLTLYQEVLAMF